jgi:hypothetical protein
MNVTRFYHVTGDLGSSKRSAPSPQPNVFDGIGQFPCLRLLSLQSNTPTSSLSRNAFHRQFVLSMNYSPPRVLAHLAAASSCASTVSSSRHSVGQSRILASDEMRIVTLAVLKSAGSLGAPDSATAICPQLFGTAGYGAGRIRTPFRP